MKTIAITILLFLSLCLNSQNINVEITKNTGSPYLLGKINKAGLEGDNYKEWFNKNFNNYAPKSTVIKAIESALKNYEITIFMGTWCGDSKREVPRFYKILEACNYPMNQLTVVALSRQSDSYKQSPQHEEAGLNIHRVPTFIFYKDGEEVNRIVEHPVNSLEDDIQNIVTVNDYKSNYQIVAEVEAILKSKGLKGFKKGKKKLLKKYAGNLESMYELNTYAHILFTTEREEEAVEVLKLNTKLFPDESRAFASLANKLHVMGKSKKALKYYKMALELDPENEQIKKNITALKSI
ncbi:thioredoxin family protein [Winogradskyella tangerina]|uniref:thioredoxin family protein n=1 Tax=Winogradskyella tangerina TaxID=2023240 RepID=UPI000DBE485C|nr:thioredoxin family protein [Winogradskyella tangerina]